jgi:hypothetical protein
LFLRRATQLFPQQGQVVIGHFTHIIYADVKRGQIIFAAGGFIQRFLI